MHPKVLVSLNLFFQPLPVVKYCQCQQYPGVPAVFSLQWPVIRLFRSRRSLVQNKYVVSQFSHEHACFPNNFSQRQR